MIEDPNKARSLARAILADVRLYNETAVRQAAPSDRTRLLADPVSEGYQLFVSRVDVQLHGVFEEAAIALYTELGAQWDGMPTPSAPVAAHPPVPGREPGREPGSPMLFVTVGLAILIVAAAAVLVLAR